MPAAGMRPKETKINLMDCICLCSEVEIVEVIQKSTGSLQLISRDTDNNAAMYNCWWTNKRS